MNLPLPASVLYPFVLPHEIAALSKSGSTALVAIDALLLKRLHLNPLAAAIGHPSHSPVPRRSHHE